MGGWIRDVWFTLRAGEKKAGVARSKFEADVCHIELAGGTTKIPAGARIQLHQMLDLAISELNIKIDEERKKV